MKIACTVRRSFPGPGGIASMMRAVTGELAKQHEVRIWAARIDGEPFTRTNTNLGAQVFERFWMDGVEILPVPMSPGTLARITPLALSNVPGIRRFGYQALRRMTAGSYARAVGAKLSASWGEPDLVHAWGGEHLGWAAGKAAGRAGIPFVVTPFAHPDEWGDDRLNVEFYKRAGLVLALLPSEAAYYASLGVDAARVRVVGVPAPNQVEGGPDVRARHGIGEDPVVLFLGVKERYKGYRTLLEAADHVWASHPTTRFAFVGPSTEASREDFAAVSDERIIEVDRVEDAEVTSWHRAATVFCLPSTSEIMPVAIMEAWAAETPVVAARWWCADDVISHGVDGLVADPDPEPIAAALVSLLSDHEAAAVMGRAGRDKVASEYAPSAVADRHLAAYREAAQA